MEADRNTQFQGEDLSISEEPALSAVHFDEDQRHGPLMADGHIGPYESWSSGYLPEERTLAPSMETDTLELYPEQLCSVVSGGDSLLDENAEFIIKVEPLDELDIEDHDPYHNGSSHAQAYRALDNRELVLQLEPICPQLVEKHLSKARALKTKRKSVPRYPRLKKILIKVEPEDPDENPYDLDTIHAKSLAQKELNLNRRKQKQPVKIPVRLTRPSSALLSGRKGRKKADKNVEPLDRDVENSPDEDLSDAQDESGMEVSKPKRKRGRPKKVQLEDDEPNDKKWSTPVKRKRKQKQGSDIEAESVVNEESPVLQKRKRKQKQSVVDDEDALDGEDEESESPSKKRRRSNKKRTPKEKPNVIPPEIGPCALCLLKFYTEEELKEHSCVQYCQLDNKRWQCGLCPQNSGKKDEMIIHLRKHTGERPFKCKYGCGAAFKDKRKCRVHQMSRKHENDKKYCCGICDLRFTSSTLLRCHEATHGEKKFFCSFDGCTRGFLTRISLTYHERRHKNVRVICKVCNEGIFQADRSRHEKRCQKRKEKEAEELKPFQDTISPIPENREGIHTCGECRLQFDSEFNLMAHPCCHFLLLAENVWRCGICSKIKKMPFSDFKEHLKVHTAARKYSCPICGKKFRYESRKNLHMSTHSGLKNFLCQTCGASYTTRARFVGHLKAKHPEIPPESVIPLKRPGKRQEDETISDPQPVVVHQRKSRGPNRKSSVRPTLHTEQEQHVELTAAAYSVQNQNQLPPPFSIPYTINQPQLEQLQAFGTNPSVPHRQMLPDPREWNWQWQTQPQPNYAPHPHQPYYQYHPQHIVDPTQSYEPSGPSSVASASLEGSEESIGTPYQSDNFAEEPNSTAGSDWQDDFEDPWESVFPSKAVSPTKSRQKRPEKTTIVVTNPTTTDSQEQVPAVDESELITKIAQNKWRCNTCSRVSSYLFEMRSHVRIHLGIKPFACPQCDKRFKDKRNMKVHYRIHTGEFPYQCPHPQCGKKFRHNAPFNAHKRTHGDLSFLNPTAQDLPFECTICAQRYRTDEELKAHKCPNYRAIENGFNCGICQKYFRRRREAANHVLTHTGENPYCCDQCGKGFKKKRLMLQHQEKAHLGILKTFNCSVCSKVFTTKHNKDIHERKHRQELLEICNICAMGFFDKQSYKHHIARHEAGGPTFKCTVCSTELTTKYELCVHSKSHGIFPKTKPNRKRKTGSENAQAASAPSESSEGPSTSTEPRLNSSDSVENATKKSLRPRVSSSKARGKRNTKKQSRNSSSDDSNSEESDSDDASEDEDESGSEEETETQPKMRVMRVKITTA